MFQMTPCKLPKLRSTIPRLITAVYRQSCSEHASPLLGFTECVCGVDALLEGANNETYWAKYRFPMVEDTSEPHPLRARRTGADGKAADPPAALRRESKPSTTSSTASSKANECSSSKTSSADQSNFSESHRSLREREPALREKSKAWPLVAGVAGIGSAILILSALDNRGSSDLTPHRKAGINELTLSVVIMAGIQTWFSKSSRVRELGVFLRNVRSDHLEHGVLIIFSVRGGHWSQVGNIRVKDHVDQRTNLSARVFTNVKVNETNWDWKTQPTDNMMYCCDFRFNGSSAAFGCLRLQPRWMEKMLPNLGKLSLRALAIPGTHQSGAIRRARFMEPWSLYADCQEETVYTQLLYGIRFLDLRPAAVEPAHPDAGYEGNTYLIVHWNHYESLSHILWDVKHFIDAFEKEVVIIDFHELPEGFDRTDAHGGLQRLVNSILGRDIFRGDRISALTMTLEEIVQRGERVLATFEKDEYLQLQFLPGVYHIWANTDKLSYLREYLREAQELEIWEKTERFYSAMAEVTPQGFLKIGVDWYGGGVRGLAHKHNLEISSWYEEDESMRKYANIIAMDYFASSDIIDICLSINRERMKDPERANKLARGDFG